MKKLSKIKLKEVLNDQEMKLVVGGAVYGSVCPGDKQEDCGTGVCYSGNSKGRCGWSGGSINTCTCAIVEVGEPE